MAYNFWISRDGRSTELNDLNFYHLLNIYHYLLTTDNLNNVNFTQFQSINGWLPDIRLRIWDSNRYGASLENRTYPGLYPYKITTHLGIFKEVFTLTDKEINAFLKSTNPPTRDVLKFINTMVDLRKELFPSVYPDPLPDTSPDIIVDPIESKPKPTLDTRVSLIKTQLTLF
jgi:hypothetical protein